MSRLPSVRLLSILVVFSLTACSSMLPGQLSLRPQHARRVAFNEAAFSPYGSAGSSAIVGVLGATDSGDEYHSGADCRISLTPVTPYTQEQVERSLGRDETLTAEDPRLRRYVRKTTADSNGQFSFASLPAGEYYAIGLVGWTLLDDSPAFQWACQRVTVAKGQTVNLKLTQNPGRE